MPYYRFSLIPLVTGYKSKLDLIVYSDQENPSQTTLATLFYGECAEEILSRYHMIDIERLSDCDGCRNKALGQKAHMECDTGCLHDKDICFRCIRMSLTK